MRILSWNILHGGGPERTPEIALALIAKSPSVVVLTEFRTTRGTSLRTILADHGLEHQIASHGGGRANGILIASRKKIKCSSEPSDGRFLDVRLPEANLFLTAVHVPDDSDLPAKSAHWQRIVRLGRIRREERALVIGDFNTGRRGQDAESGVFACEALMGTLCSLGYQDAWRARNPGIRDATWVAPWGEGRRIDAVFVSTPLAPDVTDVSHLHEDRDRGLSDHSALLVGLIAPTCASSLPAPGSPGTAQTPSLFAPAATIRRNFT